MNPTHEAFEQLSAYLDGELSERETTAVEAHLATCADCARALDALRATAREVRALEDPVPSEQDSWALRAAVARARRRAEQPRSVQFAMAASGAAAVLITLVFAVSQFGASDRQAALAPEAGTEGLTGPDVVVTKENFNERSARSLLLGYALGSEAGASAYDSSVPAPAPAAGSIEGSTGVGGGAVEDSGTTGAAENIPAPQALAPQAPAARAASGAGTGPSSLSRRIADCQRIEILPHTDDRLEAVSYRSARYKRQPAFLLVFRVPDAKPARLELWVLHRETCRTLYFTQQTTS